MQPTNVALLIARIGLSAILLSASAVSIRLIIATPKIEVSSVSVAINAALEHGQIDKTVEIRNRGSAALEIGRIVKSCSCTEVSIGSRRILPGGVTKLFIRLARPTDASIIVQSNDPANSAIRIRLSIVTDKEVNVYPERFNFGTVRLYDMPHELSGTVYLNKNSPRQFQIDSLEVQATSQLLEVKTIALNDFELGVNVTFDPSVTGELNEGIEILQNGVRLGPLIPVIALVVNN